LECRPPLGQCGLSRLDFGARGLGDERRRSFGPLAQNELRRYTSVYLRFLERCLATGVTAPIVPGIMPVSNYAQAVKFSAMCGASVPAWLGHMFEGTENDPEHRRIVASIVAAEQVRVLQANGVDEFHFYTLNRPELTYAIAHVLGVRPGISSSGLPAITPHNGALPLPAAAGRKPALVEHQK
jgi:hypothetical protein